MVVRADLYLLIFFLLIVIHKDRLGKVKGGNIRSVMQTVVSSLRGGGGGETAPTKPLENYYRLPYQFSRIVIQ